MSDSEMSPASKASVVHRLVRFSIVTAKSPEIHFYTSNTRYEAWKKFYEAENTFADNQREFTEIARRRGFRCVKT